MVKILTTLANRPSGTVENTQSSSETCLSRELKAIPRSLVEIDGQSVNVADLTHALQAIINRLIYPESFLICTLNVDHLVKLRRDSELRKAYARAELVTADGFPIVILGRIRGCQLQRAAGSDLIEPLCTVAARHRLPIFFLGSTFSVLSKSARRLTASRPNLEIAGVYAPSANFAVQSAEADEAIALNSRLWSPSMFHCPRRSVAGSFRVTRDRRNEWCCLPPDRGRPRLSGRHSSSLSKVFAKVKPRMGLASNE